MTSSRLTLLIDSLASGADVFTSRASGDKSTDMNEMDIVLNGASAQVRLPVDRGSYVELLADE